MTFRSLAWAPLGLLALSWTWVACTEQTTDYGPPEGLKGAMFPAPMGTGTGSSPPPPGMDAGMTPPPPGEDSGTTPPTEDSAAPPPAGDTGTGGACAVSWSTTIYPDLTTKWGCAAGGTCHGAGTAPAMSTGNATGVYNTFKAFTPAMGAPGGLNYIVPGNTNPASSSFLCSIDPTGTCGALMPFGDTAANTPVTASDLQAVTTWLTCGAPDN
jgi:hypothetical protein